MAQTPGFSAQTRLHVYRYAYSARLIESLEDDFSQLKTLLGSKRFLTLARDYVDSTPSRFSSLGEYSPGFLKFISKRRSKYKLSLKALLAARRDWLKVLAFLTPDGPDTPPDVLAQLTQNPAKVRLSPNPSLSRLGKIAIWQKHGTVFERTLNPAELKILTLTQDHPSPIALARRLRTTRLTSQKLQNSLASLTSDKILVMKSK